MRIVLIGSESGVLGAALAEYLHLDHIRHPEEISADGFVLDGAPRDVAEARALDAVLRGRAADVSAVVWVTGRPPTPQVEAVLDHYRGRVVEVDPGEGAFDAALEGLRESLLTA